MSLWITGAACRDGKAKKLTGPQLGGIECANLRAEPEETETEMEQINPERIKQLLNEGTPQPSGRANVRTSYAASVMNELNRYFAGNPSRPVDEELDLMVEAWTLTLQDLVPERRLAECIASARRERSSTFTLDVSEVCGAWQRIKTAEREAMPRVGQYDFRGKEVCPHCNNTGTRLMVKRDPLLQRDYTYGVSCEIKK